MKMIRLAQNFEPEIYLPNILTIFEGLKGRNLLEWVAQDKEWHTVTSGSIDLMRQYICFVKSASISTKIYSYRLKFIIGPEDSLISISVYLYLNTKRSLTGQGEQFVAEWQYAGEPDEDSISNWVESTFGLKGFILTPNLTKKVAPIGQKLPNVIRLTREKTRFKTPVQLEIFVKPKRLIGYEIYFNKKDLETGEESGKTIIADRSETGDELTMDMIEQIVNQTIARAKNSGYVDEKNRNYIPVGANADNYDFLLNDWKKQTAPQDTIQKEEEDYL